MMKLSETIELMNSKDYKERFKAEYLQLKIRTEGLTNMLDKYKKGELDFTLKCSYELLDNQLQAMENYGYYLEKRAKIEEIELI